MCSLVHEAKTDLIQVVEAPELSLAAIAVVRRVFVVLVLLECCFIFEDVGAFIARQPVVLLLVLQA